MHNITTIYRFNTPFLDIESEKNGLLNVVRKIEKSLKFDGIFKTLILDINSMKKIEEKDEELQTFFKSVYNVTEKSWHLLDFKIADENEKDEEKKYQKGSFSLKKSNLKGKPVSFDRKTFQVKTGNGTIDIWEESKK